MKRLTPYHFFLKYAGYSYDPAKETAHQGRIRCAQSLAQAERMARDYDLRFQWEIDPDINSSEFSDEDPPWHLWEVICYSADGNIVGCLGGVDFGRDRDPWMDPYRRVVEAELASEYEPVEEENSVKEEV
jgi:hypothetical protein